MENKLDDLKVPDVIRAPRTDPIYNCHAYLTKVPVAAILPFVQQFTRPGDVVLDPFAGSGMTGLAAAMEGRRAQLADISVLGQHIAQGYLMEVSPSESPQGCEAGRDGSASRGRRPLHDAPTARRESRRNGPYGLVLHVRLPGVLGVPGVLPAAGQRRGAARRVRLVQGEVRASLLAPAR